MEATVFPDSADQDGVSGEFFQHCFVGIAPVHTDHQLPLCKTVLIEIVTQEPDPLGPDEAEPGLFLGLPEQFPFLFSPCFAGLFRTGAVMEIHGDSPGLYRAHPGKTGQRKLDEALSPDKIRLEGWPQRISEPPGTEYVFSFFAQQGIIHVGKNILLSRIGQSDNLSPDDTEDPGNIHPVPFEKAIGGSPVFKLVPACGQPAGHGVPAHTGKHPVNQFSGSLPGPKLLEAGLAF